MTVIIRGCSLSIRLLVRTFITLFVIALGIAVTAIASICFLTRFIAITAFSRLVAAIAIVGLLVAFRALAIATIAALRVAFRTTLITAIVLVAIILAATLVAVIAWLAATYFGLFFNFFFAAEKTSNTFRELLKERLLRIRSRSARSSNGFNSSILCLSRFFNIYFQAEIHFWIKVLFVTCLAD